MKKILFSIFAATMFTLTSCISFDDPVTEKYGEGPEVTITVNETSDNAFTFTVTPAEGTQWYSYLVDEADEAEELSPATLLKGGYTSVANAVVEAAKAPTTTNNMIVKDAPICKPNTTYVIYAIAANDKGIVGHIATAVVTTTDSNAPETDITDFHQDKDGSVVASFSEKVYRGEGKVSAKYYKEFDLENPVDVAEEDITVDIDGNLVLMAAANVPAGAYVAYSYEAGAFKDSKGLLCGAVNTSLNYEAETEDELFVGFWAHVENEAFEINDEMLSPEAGVFPDWTKFVGTVKFDFPIYEVEDYKELGDISVTYKTAKRSTTVKLAPTDWSVNTEESTLTFKLPEAPDAGALVSVNFVKDIIFDVYGNGNAAFSSEFLWKCFAMTKDMVFGNFNLSYVSYFDKAAYDGGTFSIVEDPEVENGVIIKDLLLPGTEVKGTYDLDKCTVSISGKEQVFGTYTSKSGTIYGVTILDANEEDNIVFTVNADGSMETENWIGFYLYSEDFMENVGWFEVFAATQFAPAPAAAKGLKVSTRTTSVKKLSAKTLKKKFAKKSLKNAKRMKRVVK